MIDNPEIERLARELGAYTGEDVDEAVINSLRERLQKQQLDRKSKSPLEARLMAIGRRCAALPVLDARPPEEILGYDSVGLPN